MEPKSPTTYYTSGIQRCLYGEYELFRLRLLDKAISMFEAGGKDADLARTVLERYTLCRFAQPQQWREWYENNKDRLFFTESGGYLWLVNTLDPSVPGNDYSVLEQKEEIETSTIEPAGITDRQNPVALAARIDGEDIVVTMTVHEGFHTYAIVDNADPFIATELAFELPDGLTIAGELKYPISQPTDNATTLLVGTGEYRQRIEGKAHGTITCTVRYQSCDATICFPPTKKVLEIEI